MTVFGAVAMPAGCCLQAAASGTEVGSSPAAVPQLRGRLSAGAGLQPSHLEIFFSKSKPIK